MNEKAQRFPLAWPPNWKRTPPAERRRAPFRSHKAEVTVAVAIDRLERELRLLDAPSAEILSTNVAVGLRGLPRSSGPEPSDPGVAVYFSLAGRDICMASDKWDRVADNIAAIAQHIDALRRIERYGVGRVEQAFAGYLALPEHVDDWRLILGVGDYATLDQVDAAFLEQAKTAHPDMPGGSHDAMAKLTAARDFARRVLG